MRISCPLGLWYRLPFSTHLRMSISILRYRNKRKILWSTPMLLICVMLLFYYYFGFKSCIFVLFIPILSAYLLQLFYSLFYFSVPNAWLHLVCLNSKIVPSKCLYLRQKLRTKLVLVCVCVPFGGGWIRTVQLYAQVYT